MSTEPKLSFKQQQLIVRENAIVDATNSLLAKKGYDLMTMDEVAAEVGIAKAFMDLSARLLSNPYQLAQAQMNMVHNYFSLWQNSMMRMMGMQAEATVAPERSDKRFKDEGWQQDFVFDFIKRVTDRELCSDFRNRISRCFRGQSRRARHPRVNLDRDNFICFRIQRELNITSTRKLTDGVHHLDRHITHALVNRVRKRHRWRNRNRITGVNTHWIEVFDRTDNNHVP